MKNTGNQTWVVRIESAMISASDLIRIAETGLIAEDGASIWIKLEGEATLVESLSAKLPGQRWQLLSGMLHPPQKRVPTDFLPELQWRSVREAVDLQIPRPGVAARFSPNQRRNIQLIRGGRERSCGALITSIERLIEWVEAVPDARLKSLTWVVEHHLSAESETAGSSTARCIIVGERLPPVAGTLMVVEQKILIPAGFRWEPPISTAQIRYLTGTQLKQWLVWESTETYSHIHDEDFAAMSRAGLRSLRNQQPSKILS